MNSDSIFNSKLKKIFATGFFLATALIHAESGDFFNAVINPELQDNFTVVSSVHNYDLNPHTAAYSADAQILSGLYEGLFTYDPITLEPLYAIAKSHKISRDKKRWTFSLRDDAKFSDGAPITAKNVAESWMNLLANPNASYSSLFDIVKGAEEYRTGKLPAEEVGITVIDDFTITVHLKAPASHLSKLLCMPAFAVVQKDLTKYSGAFILVETSENSFILKKNENYYDAEKVPLRQISILLSSDETENSFAFNTGDIDWLTSAFDTDKLLSKDSINIYAEFATQYYFFKIRKDSIWNNAEMRQAVLEAAPWDELRANTYVKATTLVYPLNGYPETQGYVYTDKDEARLLLKDGKKAVGLSIEEIPVLKFAVPDSTYMKERAELLKSAMFEIGINLEIIPVPELQYLTSIPTMEADLFSYTWIGDFADPLAFLELFRGNSTMNVSNWKNEKFDQLLDEAAIYTDENHNKLLSQAEQILLDDAIILPIQHPVSVNVINLNAVGGWAINAFDIHPFKYLFKRETKDNIPNIVRHEVPLQNNFSVAHIF